MKIRTTTQLLSVVALSLAALAGVPALAEGLEGTAWHLTGGGNAQMRGVKAQRFSADSTLYFVDATTCRLDVVATSRATGAPVIHYGGYAPAAVTPPTCPTGAACIPCTWEATSATRFTLNFDDATLNQIVTDTLASALGPLAQGVSVTLKTDQGKGIYRPAAQRIKLNVKFQASVTAPLLPGARTFTLVMGMTGTPVTP